MLAITGYTNTGFTAAERVLFNRIFEETLDKHIPALLFDIWDTRYVTIHPLPQTGEGKIELYYEAATTILTIDAFADYLNLPDVDDPEKIIEKVEALAEKAAHSYAWNVRNAFIKGGRLHSGQKLHVTDWQNEFRFNIVRNKEAWSSPWAAYRYRFGAIKV